MTRMLLIALISLTGCATQAPPVEVHSCPPLPALSKDATAEERGAHYLLVIKMYGQCAGERQ